MVAVGCNVCLNCAVGRLVYGLGDKWMGQRDDLQRTNSRFIAIRNSNSVNLKSETIILCVGRIVWFRVGSWFCEGIIRKRMVFGIETRRVTYHLSLELSIVSERRYVLHI